MSELAWAAGFWDGEGTVSVGYILDHGKTDRWYVSASVEQMHDRRCVDRFYAAVGMGKIYGPYVKQYRGGELMRYMWRLSGYGKVLEFTQLLDPFISEPKKEQIARSFAHEGIGPDKRFGPRTHCPLGHPLTGENLRVKPGGKRSCRECERSRQQERRLSRAELKSPTR